MRLPFGNRAVTLLRRCAQTDAAGRRHEAYVPIMLTGCSWRPRRFGVEVGSARMDGQSAVCRIPADQPKPAAGDILLCGTLDEGGSVSPSEAAALLRERGREAMRVGSVIDGTGGPLKHWRCEGEQG